MQRDPRAYLWDVEQAVTRIFTFVSSLDFEAYTSNEMVRSAVERQFGIIGEALSQLSKADPELVALIPEWREAVGFRNLLIHGYALVKDERVWNVIAAKLPPLLATIRSQLARLGS